LMMFQPRAIVLPHRDVVSGSHLESLAEDVQIAFAEMTRGWFATHRHRAGLGTQVRTAISSKSGSTMPIPAASAAQRSSRRLNLKISFPVRTFAPSPGGCFDRQITVDVADLIGWAQILKKSKRIRSTQVISVRKYFIFARAWQLPTDHISTAHLLHKLGLELISSLEAQFCVCVLDTLYSS
jgi:hypothetical protein